MDSRIDVIIAAYNAEPYLPEAVASIRAQTKPPSKIIVTDDGSTDGTSDWLAEQQDLIVRRQANAGAGAARNRAISLSYAPILAFLDADDLWMAGYLEAQLSTLALDDTLEAAFVRAEQFNQDTDYTESISGIIPSAMVIRRVAFDRLGGFDEGTGALDFFSWFLAAKEAGLRYHVADQVLVRRRLHDANSSREAVQNLGYVRALKQSLDRRRRGT